MAPCDAREGCGLFGQNAVEFGQQGGGIDIFVGKDICACVVEALLQRQGVFGAVGFKQVVVSQGDIAAARPIVACHVKGGGVIGGGLVKRDVFGGLVRDDRRCGAGRIKLQGRALVFHGSHGDGGRVLLRNHRNFKAIGRYGVARLQTVVKDDDLHIQNDVHLIVQIDFVSDRRSAIDVHDEFVRTTPQHICRRRRGQIVFGGHVQLRVLKIETLDLAPFALVQDQFDTADRAIQKICVRHSSTPQECAGKKDLPGQKVTDRAASSCGDKRAAVPPP
mmetsp:Transcript_22456/g.36282  ORF Transcript_22456/g.36282 Transcript_22456/m.36282 type:complete len:277 (+) Transcript_22456:1109-1939(+)